MGRRLIIADENIPQVAEYFSPLGEVRTVTGRALAAEQVAEADLLLVRSVTEVGPALLEGSRIGWVGTATIGTDHLDTEYLAHRQIPYASAPGSNANSVVEYVLSALAAVGDTLERLLAGQARVGIVGLGNVGGRLLQRLQKLGVAAVGYDPFLSHVDRLPLRSLREVLRSDVVCLHTPLTTTGPWPTRHLIGAAELELLPPGALLLNAGRGSVLDNVAAVAELERRPQLQLVLDVWEGEPQIDPSLLALAAIGTPHIAGYSLDGKLAGTRQLLEACCRHLELPVPPIPSSHAPAPCLRLQPGLESAELMRRVLLGSYNIRRDDASLRQGTAASNREASARHFDQLRREYPVRRELAAADMVGWDALSARERTMLSALGARCR